VIEIGAFRRSGNPSIVFVFARSGYSAIRVSGVWKTPSELTIGELVDDFDKVRDMAEVRALLRAARELLSLALTVASRRDSRHPKKGSVSK
jgi:hypothetical protein